MISAFGVEHGEIAKGDKARDFAYGYGHGKHNARTNSAAFGRKQGFKLARHTAKTNDDTYNKYTRMPSKAYVAGATVGAARGALASPRELERRRRVIRGVGFNSYEGRRSPEKPHELTLSENRSKYRGLHRAIKSGRPQG